MIDIAGGVAYGAFVKHKLKRDYESGHGDESLAAATMVMGMNAGKKGTKGALALGGLYGIQSALRDIENKERLQGYSQAAYNGSTYDRYYDEEIVDEIPVAEVKTNDNRYAWRMNCEDGSAYGVYPENYETREAYNNAIKRAKSFGDPSDDMGTEGEEAFNSNANEPTFEDLSQGKEEFVFCRVSRLDNGHNQYYLAGGLDLKIGDIVLVLGESGTAVKAVVLSIERHTRLTAPQPPENTEEILRKG